MFKFIALIPFFIFLSSKNIFGQTGNLYVSIQSVFLDVPDSLSRWEISPDSVLKTQFANKVNDQLKMKSIIHLKMKSEFYNKIHFENQVQNFSANLPFFEINKTVPINKKDWILTTDSLKLSLLGNSADNSLNWTLTGYYLILNPETLLPEYAQHFLVSYPYKSFNPPLSIEILAHRATLKLLSEKVQE